jgi:hypothetical protein
MELGYTGSRPTNSYKRFYHGEGVPSGANNITILRIKATNRAGGSYAEFLVSISVRENTSIDRLEVSPIVSV